MKQPWNLTIWSWGPIGFKPPTVMTGAGIIQAQWDMISWNGKHRNGR